MRCLLLLLLLAGIAYAEEAKPPRLDAAFRRGGGTFACRVDGAAGVFTITNASGIDGVTLTLREGAWPRDVVIHYRYDAEHGFRMLEHFSVETPRLVVATFLHNPDPPAFRFKNADGTLDKDAKDAGTLNLVIIRTETDVEVHLPPNLLAGEKTVTLEWVDAYRG